MKKLCIALTVILTLLLTSCATNRQDQQTISYSYDQDNIPEYVTRAFFEHTCTDPVRKDSVVIMCPMENAALQEATENAIAGILNQKGIEAHPYSDFNTPEETVENKIHPYLLYVVYTKVYTNNSSGGISSLIFESQLFDVLADTEEPYQIATINGGTIADGNVTLSFDETVSPACQSVGEAIAMEYLLNITN